MRRYPTYIAFLLAVLLSVSACSQAQSTPTPAAANLPNPASVNCEQKGGTLEMRQDLSGGVTGVCKFPDGTECEEWAYLRGDCTPVGQNPAQPTTVGALPTSIPRQSTMTPARTAAPEVAADGWKVYQNDKMGYSFSYPPDAIVGPADDPERTVTITGPLIEGDHWPLIYVSHPNDREDYRPPAGVDLEKWLTDHNLLMTGGKLGEGRLPDAVIAGAKAIHTRLPRSPQTYAYDKYYFARSQQLYCVVILHTGDKEDWTLYNHFLASIRIKS